MVLSPLDHQPPAVGVDHRAELLHLNNRVAPGAGADAILVFVASVGVTHHAVM